MSRLGHATSSVTPRNRGGSLPAWSTAEFSDLVDTRYLKPEYQPIFDLVTGEQVAAEALARWPALGITPDEAFWWAAESGRLAELDEACRNAAIVDAIAHNLPSQFELFVNLEPSVLGPDTATRLLAHAAGRVGLVVEITERALMKRPSDLLRAVDQLREAGCGIALDDVGALPGSLALLPFICPDVVKLDVSLVQRWPDIGRAAIYTAVAAYAERTGATVLAEGIESEAHLRRALALGATLGQGWYLGWPGPPGAVAESYKPLQVHRRVNDMPTSFSGFADTAVARVGSKELLLGMSRHLEHKGMALETAPVVLTAMQEARRLTPGTARRYARLGSRCPLVVVLGTGMAPTPVHGVRGVALGADDPLRHDWVVAVVGAHYSGALIAHDLGDEGADRDRRFAFVLTHDYDRVLEAARNLLGRVTSRSDRSDPAEVLATHARR
jgi:EAL domain-containing protein (putative c-di-GMP-specific phosphodiesterase class I)